MKYKQQLYFIIVFISLRLLTTVLFAFYRPAVPGIYTPYILFLYSLFDVLILCYLYRFVRYIKQQPFSIIAILLVITSVLYSLTLNWFSVFETSKLTPSETLLVILPASLLNLAGKIMMSVYLIKNKVQDYTKKYLIWIGWTYVVVLIIGMSLPFTNFLHIQFVTDAIPYITTLSAGIPLIAMLMLYVHELRNDSDPDYYIGGPTVDSEI